MQPHTHNGATDQARTHVEAALKGAGMTPDQAHAVLEAIEEYVGTRTARPRKQKKNPAPKRRAKHR